MPNWYFDKKDIKNSPSSRDGIDFETEQRYRREGARFIIDCGTKMDLGYNTMATGVVFFHRFYMSHSFQTFPRYVTACCCLFLAGKVEETPKKCRDVIKTARSMLDDKKFKTFGEDPREETMTLERILLQTIKFDLQVDHPYGFLLKYAKSLKGDKEKLEKMVQMAWTFVNDSLCTTLCLQWEPEIIAVALMYLAGKLSKFEVTDWVGRHSKHIRWWEMFVEDMTMDLLEDICHQVLDLYSQHQQKNHQQDSPPHQQKSLPDQKLHGVPKSIGSTPKPTRQVIPAPNIRSIPTVGTHYPSQSIPPSGQYQTPYPPHSSQIPPIHSNVGVHPVAAHVPPPHSMPHPSHSSSLPHYYHRPPPSSVSYYPPM